MFANFNHRWRKVCISWKLYNGQISQVSEFQNHLETISNLYLLSVRANSKTQFAMTDPYQIILKMPLHAGPVFIPYHTLGKILEIKVILKICTFPNAHSWGLFIIIEIFYWSKYCRELQNTLRKCPLTCKLQVMNFNWFFDSLFILCVL